MKSIRFQLDTRYPAVYSDPGYHCNAGKLADIDVMKNSRGRWTYVIVTKAPILPRQDGYDSLGDACRDAVGHLYDLLSESLAASTIVEWPDEI